MAKITKIQITDYSGDQLRKSITNMARSALNTHGIPKHLFVEMNEMAESFNIRPLKSLLKKSRYVPQSDSFLMSKAPKQPEIASA